MNVEQEKFADAIDFEKSDGLVPVVVQDSKSKEVLMLAYMNLEALEKTFETGQMVYQSRERGLWHKGDTSGNFQNVISLHLDCDNDTILAIVSPDGPACHTGSITCFIDSPSITFPIKD